MSPTSLTTRDAVSSAKCYTSLNITTSSSRWRAARIGWTEYLTTRAYGYELQLWVYEMVSKT